jgi:hypothetical protein
LGYPESTQGIDERAVYKRSPSVIFVKNRWNDAGTIEVMERGDIVGFGRVSLIGTLLMQSSQDGQVAHFLPLFTRSQ